MFGSWLFFWYITWPPSALQVGAAIAGMLIGCIYNLDRLLNWDVYAWQWHDATRRNRVYPSFLYRLALFGGVLGMLSVPLMRRYFGSEVTLALIPLGGVAIGLIFLWFFAEGCCHIFYHRRQKQHE